jgi:hypothetical protein
MHFGAVVNRAAVFLTIACALFWGNEIATSQTTVPELCQRPGMSVIVFSMASSYQLRFSLIRTGDNLNGMVRFFAARPGDVGARGTVNGQFIGQDIKLQVFWEDSTQAFFQGRFSKGDGMGTAYHSKKPSSVMNWIARTLEGCPRWPDGAVVIQQPAPEPLRQSNKPQLRMGPSVGGQVLQTTKPLVKAGSQVLTTTPSQSSQAIRSATAPIKPLVTPSVACRSGFVWRESRPGDVVCVTPASRARVAEENRTSAMRRAPGGSNCVTGYVWREAFSGDLVCVPPAARSLAQEENRVGPSRRAQ